MPFNFEAVDSLHCALKGLRCESLFRSALET